MAYIVGEPCVKCKYTDCVDVCPVECFYEGENALVIHPEECIDCGACESECPTTAIFEQDDLPEKWHAWIEINAVFSGAKEAAEADVTGWPEHVAESVRNGEFEVFNRIATKKDPLPEADAMAEVEEKADDFSVKAGPGN